MKEWPKIGLALGCGGAKGLAHLGILRVLERNGIPIDYIAGSSIGALMGGCFAAFGSIKPLEEILLKTDKIKLFSLLDPSFPQKGFLNGARIKEFLEEHIGRIDFSELKIPFVAVATDLKTGKEVLINRGRVSEAIMSSISVPLVFNPREKGKKILADGGLSNPVPVEAVKKMGADFIIAVNLDNNQQEYVNSVKDLNLYNIASISIFLLRHHLAKHCVENADIIIEPSLKDISIIGWKNFIGKKREEFIKAGEIAAEKAISPIKKKLHLPLIS